MQSDAIRCHQRPSAHLLEAFGDEFRAREVDYLEPVLEAHHPEELVDGAARGGWAGAHLRIAISRNQSQSVAISCNHLGWSSSAHREWRELMSEAISGTRRPSGAP